jgi:hypothetical protein
VVLGGSIVALFLSSSFPLFFSLLSLCQTRCWWLEIGQSGLMLCYSQRIRSFSLVMAEAVVVQGGVMA